MVVACACGSTLNLLAFREKGQAAETDEVAIVTSWAVAEVTPQFLSQRSNNKWNDSTEPIRDRAPESSIPDLKRPYDVSVLDMVFLRGVDKHTGGNTRKDDPVVALLVDESGATRRSDGGDSERYSAAVCIRLCKWGLSGDRAIFPLAW